LNRRVSQLVVGDAAPEKERQPRRQVQIAEAIGGSGRQPFGLMFDAEEETRSGQDALDPALDAGIETAVGLR